MSYSYNQATLVGRVVKNPDLKEVASGKPKANFTLAVERTYRRENGKAETDFIPICLWGKMAEVSHQLLRKGMPILVWGRIQVRNYEKDNSKHVFTEVIADNFQVLDRLPHDQVEKGEQGTK